jgi:hypothetical protein
VTRVGDFCGGDRGWSATRARHSRAARGEGGLRRRRSRQLVTRGRQATERFGMGRRSCSCRLSGWQGKTERVRARVWMGFVDDLIERF